MNKRESKLYTLCSDEGIKSYSQEMYDIANESIQPGICMQYDCEAITSSVEPDCANGYCEACGKQSVMSLCELIMGA